MYSVAIVKKMDRDSLLHAKITSERSGQYMYIGKIEFPSHFFLLQRHFPEDGNAVIDMLAAKLKNELYACINAKGVIKAKKATKVATEIANTFFTRLRELDSELSMLPEIPKFFYLVAFDR